MATPDVQPLLSVFRDVLGLPSLFGEWSQSSPEYDGTSVDVVLGNIDIEILRYGTWGQEFERSNPEAASLYRSLAASDGQLRIAAIAFEPDGMVAAADELDRRGIERNRLAPWWGGSTLRLPGFVGDQADIFLSEFSFESELWKDWLGFHPRSTSELRDRGEAALRAAGGGTLGVRGVTEIIVGVTDRAREEMRWAALLDPATLIAPCHWRLDDGPTVRLISHDTDCVLRLVLAVESLARATAFLQANGVAVDTTDGRTLIDPAFLLGLDVTLVPVLAS